MKNEQAECLKIPVVVGVSGHIDVAQDEPWILSQLAVFWKKVREIVGAETPIVLLSSLAQGADHYVVRSMPEDGKRYCAVLPFAREEYEKDFVDHARKPGALDEFLQDLADWNARRRNAHKAGVTAKMEKPLDKSFRMC